MIHDSSDTQRSPIKGDAIIDLKKIKQAFDNAISAAQCIEF